MECDERGYELAELGVSEVRTLDRIRRLDRSFGEPKSELTGSRIGVAAAVG